jgi:hypothetical protein
MVMHSLLTCIVHTCEKNKTKQIQLSTCSIPLNGGF